MDKFVLKVKPKKKLLNIRPQEWAKQYPGKFHAENNLLFCSACNVKPIRSYTNVFCAVY